MYVLEKNEAGGTYLKARSN